MGLKVVLANGSLFEVTPKSNPHLWKAFGVSVGQLGVIYELTLKIKPQVGSLARCLHAAPALWPAG